MVPPLPRQPQTLGGPLYLPLPRPRHPYPYCCCLLLNLPRHSPNPQRNPWVPRTDKGSPRNWSSPLRLGGLAGGRVGSGLPPSLHPIGTSPSSLPPTAQLVLNLATRPIPSTLSCRTWAGAGTDRPYSPHRNTTGLTTRGLGYGLPLHHPPTRLGQLFPPLPLITPLPGWPPSTATTGLVLSNSGAEP